MTDLKNIIKPQIVFFTPFFIQKNIDIKKHSKFNES